SMRMTSRSRRRSRISRRRTRATRKEVEMMMRTVHSILILSALTACASEKDRHPTPTATKPAKLDHATQTDLARELDEADRRGTWREVRRRAEGQELEWTVTRHRSLCGSEAECHVAAFPIQRPAQRGWLPGIRFAPGEYQKLAACTKETCEIVIDGTLSKLDATGDM